MEESRKGGATEQEKERDLCQPGDRDRLREEKWHGVLLEVESVISKKRQGLEAPWFSGSILSQGCPL